MKEKVNLPPALLEHLPWENGVNSIWPASSFLLHRNLSKYHFPPKMSEGQFQQTFDMLQNCLMKTPLLDQPTCLKAEEISALDKQFLFEHFLCMEGFQNTLAGQGFLVDRSARFMALLNSEDHLQLQIIDCQGSWEKAWNTLNQIETSISESLELAFTPRFGYLTANPALSGTGLVIHVFLHLPALIHTGQLQETLLKQKEEEITASGMQGTLEEIVGDLLVLHNTYTLGLNEENILHSLHAMAMKLMALEKTLRTHLKEENNSEIKDRVCRAFGLLMHSYQLQTKEALSALSLMKLGLDLGWITGVTEQQLNQTFFTCRQAHLLHAIHEKALDQQAVPHKRAEFLHKQLHGITLNIET